MIVVDTSSRIRFKLTNNNCKKQPCVMQKTNDFLSVAKKTNLVLYFF